MLGPGGGGGHQKLVQFKLYPARVRVAMSAESRERMEGVQLPSGTPPPPPLYEWLWVTIQVGIGTSVPSFEARAGSASQPAAGERPTMLCICLGSFGIVWLVDWLQLTIINILSIIWCLICASHFVSLSSPTSPLLIHKTLIFFLCLAPSFVFVVCSCHDFLFWLRGAILVCLVRFGCGVRSLAILFM